ncbi:hypothetical protein IV203_007406 [Nitzschia inconspicua]|uniref:Uncharacterized protein n=1 Tax=Nitzschia inconspicua TaxID=303405 RepID=A0A9K3PCD1_9STRA|nr:hypothetical protein IV203_007406 [Nitzschia inconspicua]
MTIPTAFSVILLFFWTGGSLAVSSYSQTKNNGMLQSHHLRFTSAVIPRSSNDDRHLQDDGSTPAGETLDMMEQKETCLQDTQTFFEGLEVLQAARDAYASAIETTNLDGSSVGDEIMTIQFPQEAVAAYQQTCEEVGGYWSMIEEANFLCRSMSIEDGRPTTVVGTGSCLANTTECQDMDATVFSVDQIFDSEGLECKLVATAEDSVPTDSTGGEAETNSETEDGSDADTIEDTTTTVTDVPEESPPDGGEDQPDDTSPEGSGTDPAEAFMSPGDAACLEASEQLAANSPDLLAAAEDYQQAIFIDGMDHPAGGMTMGYNEDAVVAMQQACDAVGGYWNVISNEDFFCDMMGLTEQKLTVVNFGSCLSDIKECRNMDIGHLLESIWDVMGMVCRGSNDEDFNEGDETEAEDQDENDSIGDASGGVDDQSIGNPDSDGLDGLDLSDSEQICIVDTQEFVTQNPEIKAASETFGQTIVVDMNDGNGMKIGFPDDAVANLRSACENANGYFNIVSLQYFSCDMSGFVSTLEVTNVGDCMAMTDECRNMSPLHMMESVWQAMGLECTEKEEGQDSDGTNAPTNEENTGNHGLNPDESAEAIAIGLTEDDVGCMHDSNGFVQKSEELSLAAQDYAKAVEMHDPTKLGFPADAAADMEKVCRENDGLWAVIDSDDIFCFIEGHNRKINIYNFGNCLSQTSHCNVMDPMVLVKAFFWEIFTFKCQTKEELSANSSAANNPGFQGQGGGNPTVLGSSQSSTTTTANDGVPSYVTAVVVLIVVVAFGFFAFYKMKGGEGRERIRQYEMTDVSDLSFDNNFMT